ncbi:hypothetical protein EKO27_g10676 [Xylaria grammica]|uniref:Uncharacterized protein n=1 Tax=Xylaria grammica TaxID=363999 RepID=A0A439CQM4_9PEZI|nr:hypothetical protein EKO27_g10676 [Xylaria grammica]
MFSTSALRMTGSRRSNLAARFLNNKNSSMLGGAFVTKQPDEHLDSRALGKNLLTRGLTFLNVAHAKDDPSQATGRDLLGSLKPES